MTFDFLSLFFSALAQRSAQELPVIESISLNSCSVEGGEELLLSGSNFLPISRVLFTERGTGKSAYIIVIVYVFLFCVSAIFKISAEETMKEINPH